VKYPDGIRREAILMIRMGKSVTEVSKHLGIHFTTIKSWMIKEGLVKIPRNNPNEEDMNKTLDMLREGKTEYIISRKLNLRIDTIIEWSKDFHKEGFL
jgi:transposase